VFDYLFPIWPISAVIISCVSDMTARLGKTVLCHHQCHFVLRKGFLVPSTTLIGWHIAYGNMAYGHNAIRVSGPNHNLALDGLGVAV
jgi:hypothetical protein